MRTIGMVGILGVLVLGAVLFGFWGGGWSKKDIKKVAGTAQEKFNEFKGNAEAAVQSVTA
jgi:hypothetical protein